MSVFIRQPQRPGAFPKPRQHYIVVLELGAAVEAGMENRFVYRELFATGSEMRELVTTIERCEHIHDYRIRLFPPRDNFTRGTDRLIRSIAKLNRESPFTVFPEHTLYS
jgi:hypothetical protein